MIVHLVSLLALSITMLPLRPHTFGRVIYKPHKKVARGLDTQTNDGQEVYGQVRIGNAASAQEIVALKNRLAKNKKALEFLLQKNLSPESKIPVIGVAASGGGFRASIACLGMLRGLERIGMLDAVTYISTLSGSTWTAASWLMHRSSPLAMTNKLRSKLYQAFSTKNIDKAAITKKIASKVWDGKKLSLNDFWGNLIGNVFLSIPTDDGLNYYLHDLAPQTTSGEFPIPIFTSVIGQTNPRYEWVEYTPFEIGSTYLKSWISPELFGKRFKDGLTTDSSRPENFAYLLGIFGSAYAGSMIDALQFIKDGLETVYNIDISSNWFNWLWGNNARISPPEIPNFARGLQNPLRNENKLTLVDAGMAINVPVPPLLRRGVKIYFICDAGTDANSPIGTEMRKIEEWAREHGYKFPAMNFESLTSQPFSIWAHPTDKEMPIVIHIPNKIYHPTAKFSYTGQEFIELCSSIENTLIQNVEPIAQALWMAMDHINS